MRHASPKAPWKRLTFALALSAASFVLASAPRSEAKPITPACPFGNSVITAWYSDPGLTQGWCQDVTTPCPGYSATHYCDGSHTPYSKQICVSCPLS
jgi:hypothetical protein